MSVPVERTPAVVTRNGSGAGGPGVVGLCGEQSLRCVHRDGTVETASEDVRVRTHVEGAEDRCDTLVLIAHNPGVHQLAFELLSEGGASEQILDRVRIGFAPATAAVFLVDASGRCTYDGILTPDAAGRP